jgi:hypothetical protein
VTSRPDDGGPATTVVTMNELDGCMDGLNEHGLAVVLLVADAETASTLEPAGPQVGLSPTQLPRYVLDTCANVAQAKRALLDAKQYHLGIPLHYLIADRTGAFVWEHDGGGVEHIVPGDGGRLCVTNHMLHRRPDPQHPPRDNDETMLTHQRLATLTARTGAGPMSRARLGELLDEVRFDAARAGRYPIRTLWQTVIDLDEITMSTRFYLGDDADGRPRYGAETTFRP